MCQRVTCPKCHKATFAGCGMHVEQVLRGVPAEQRCTCNQKAAAPPGGAATPSEPAPKRAGWRPFG